MGKCDMCGRRKAAVIGEYGEPVNGRKAWEFCWECYEKIEEILDGACRGAEWRPDGLEGLF